MRHSASPFLFVFPCLASLADEDRHRDVGGIRLTDAVRVAARVFRVLRRRRDDGDARHAERKDAHALRLRRGRHCRRIFLGYQQYRSESAPCRQE